MNAMSTNAKATALMSMAISNSFPQALSAVFGLLASIGSAFISVCLANPVLLVVGGILAVAGITLMAGMIVAGARNKGSRIGLEIGLFTVKDICELV